MKLVGGMLVPQELWSYKTMIVNILKTQHLQNTALARPTAGRHNPENKMPEVSSPSRRMRICFRTQYRGNT